MNKEKGQWEHTMQIVAVKREDPNSADLIDAMHKLRARIFQRRLNWNVQIREGGEYDKYDEYDPTYLLVLSDERNVIGCMRFLPTQTMMLMREFSELLPEGRLDVHPGMIECSRLCIDTTYSCPSPSKRSVHLATRVLFAGMVEWSIMNNYNEIILVTDLRVERIFSMAGWAMRRIGGPRQINETMSVALRGLADYETFKRLRPADYSSQFQ